MIKILQKHLFKCSNVFDVIILIYIKRRHVFAVNRMTMTSFKYSFSSPVSVFSSLVHKTHFWSITFFSLFWTGQPRSLYAFIISQAVVFCRRKKLSKRWRNCHFWVNYSFLECMQVNSGSLYCFVVIWYPRRWCFWKFRIKWKVDTSPSKVRQHLV